MQADSLGPRTLLVVVLPLVVALSPGRGQAQENPGAVVCKPGERLTATGCAMSERDCTQYKNFNRIMGKVTCPESPPKRLIDAYVRDRRLDFRGLNFKGAQLVKAMLKAVDFSGSDLSGADLRGANLQGVLFRQTNLSGANLSGADLTGARFETTNLTDVTLTDANLTTAILVDVNAQRLKSGGLKGLPASADSSCALAEGYLFASGVDLSGITFKAPVNLKGKRLVGIKLKGSMLKGSTFAKADLTQAELSEANLEGSDFSQAKLDKANLAGANLTATIFRGAFLLHSSFEGATLVKTTFDSATCVSSCQGIPGDAALHKPRFANTNFTDAKLEGVKIGYGRFNGANFTRANLSGVEFTEADFSGANLTAVNLPNAIFCGSFKGVTSAGIQGTPKSLCMYKLQNGSIVTARGTAP